MGLRGQAVVEYVNDWIVAIEDITDYVMELDTMRRAGMDITEKLPIEIIYEQV